MDNSVQGSMSSVSTSIQALDTHAGASGSNPPSEFVNHGKYKLLRPYLVTASCL